MKVKCKWLHPGFELGSPYPFSTIIIVTLDAFINLFLVAAKINIV